MKSWRYLPTQPSANAASLKQQDNPHPLVDRFQRTIPNFPSLNVLRGREKKHSGQIRRSVILRDGMISFETRFLKPFVIVFIFILRWPGAAACPTKIKEKMSRAFFTRTFGVLARRAKQRPPLQTPGTDFLLLPMLASCSHSSLTRKQEGWPPEWLKTATDSLDVKSFQGLLSPTVGTPIFRGMFCSWEPNFAKQSKGEKLFLTAPLETTFAAWFYAIPIL